MLIRTKGKNLSSYLNRENLIFWLVYILLISGIVFSIPNGYFGCEREIGQNYCRETLGNFFNFPWFGPYFVYSTWLIGAPVIALFHLVSMTLHLGWEFPLVSQPYNERIPTLPLIGWLGLLLTFYVYVKIIFWVIKLLHRTISKPAK